MSDTRAFRYPETSYDVLRRAFNVNEVSLAEVKSALPFGKEDCERIHRNITFFVDRTAAALNGSREDLAADAQHEVWAALDLYPLLTNTDVSDAGSSSAEVLVQQVKTQAKRLLLYAHRLVVFDYLAEFTKAIATHTGDPDVLEDSLPALRSRASAAALAYGALCDLLADEIVVLGRSPRQNHGDNHAFIAKHRTAIKKYSQRAAEDFRRANPNNRLVATDRSFGGGIILSGQIGASGAANYKDQRDLNLLTEMLAQGLIPMRRSCSYVHPCFDSIDVAKLYGHMISTLNNYQFDAVKLPVFMTELSINGALMPEKLKLADVIGIRRNEEVFGTWRELLGTVLERMSSTEFDNARRTELLRQEIREREAAWRGRFKALIKQDTLLSRAIDPTQSVLTGLCAGALHAMLTGAADSTTVAVAATGAASKDLLVCALELMLGREDRITAQSLSSHFLAVGSEY